MQLWRKRRLPPLFKARRAPPARMQAGGGLTPPGGNTAARPPFFCGLWVLIFSVFGELVDICNILGQVGTTIAPPGGKGGSGEPLGPILEAKWWPRRRQKRPKRGGKATQGAKRKTQEVPQDSITTLGCHFGALFCTFSPQRMFFEGVFFRSAFFIDFKQPQGTSKPVKHSKTIVVLHEIKVSPKSKKTAWERHFRSNSEPFWARKLIKLHKKTE